MCKDLRVFTTPRFWAPVSSALTITVTFTPTLITITLIKALPSHSC